ncbi:MAG: response regulator [Sandaracinaceae bacterium]
MTQASLRVLLVEDNDDSAEMLARRLRLRGFTVRRAADGAAAVDAATRDRPDIILMDLTMPGMDGWTATAEIRKDPSLENTRIIAVTAHAMSEDEERAREVGCDAFHTKPVNLALLIEQIRALM